MLLKNDKGTIFGKVSFELAFAGYEEEAKSREGIFIGDYENKRLQEGGEVRETPADTLSIPAVSDGLLTCSGFFEQRRHR